MPIHTDPRTKVATKAHTCHKMGGSNPAMAMALRGQVWAWDTSLG